MKKLSQEDKAGLYITVIVHLAVLIVLLAGSIGSVMKGGDSFLIDFSAQEAEERKAAVQEKTDEQEAFDEAISQKLDELINGTSGQDFKNFAVDRSALKDDRGTDADQLYKDAERLASDLKNGFEVEDDENYATITKKAPQKKPAQQKQYSGPSVVSYSLAGRKASRLPIPAYRCYGGGMVTVIIVVDPSGRVTDARIQDETSSDDSCLRDFAIRAARMSRFSADPHAPARQAGDIVYQFIAQ